VRLKHRQPLSKKLRELMYAMRTMPATDLTDSGRINMDHRLPAQCDSEVAILNNIRFIDIHNESEV
jgi:hypothetical protein